MMKRLLFFIPTIIFLFCLVIKANGQTDQVVTGGTLTAPANFPANGCAYTWTNNNPGIGIPAGGTGDIASFKAINNGSVPVIATITAVPVTPAFAYIANSGSNNVSVISTISKTVVTTIPVQQAPFGVAANNDGALVYVTNGGSNSISVISTVTNTVTATFTVGNKPQGIAVSTDGTRLYVACQNDNSLQIIDAANGTILNTIAVGLAPYGVAVTPSGSKVYVTNFAGRSVSVISTSSGLVTATIGTGDNPAAIAVSPNGAKVYVSVSGAALVTVITTATDASIKDIRTIGSPAGITFSPDGTRVYLGCGGGYFTVLDGVNDANIMSTAASGVPRGISVTPDGSTVYIVDAINNAVEYLNSYSAIGGQILVGVSPQSFGVFISKSTGCGGVPVTFTITVNPAPKLKAINFYGENVAIGNIYSCQGDASSGPNVTSFMASGAGLTDMITITAPANFEVSLNAAGSYSSSLTLTPLAGKVNNTDIFVRSAATAPSGHITGDIVLSSPNATNVTFTVNAVISALPVANPVPNQQVINGASTAAINFTGTANTFTWTSDNTAIGLAANGTGNIPAFTAVNNTGSPIKANITVTPSSVGRAYIPCYGNKTLTVVNTNNNTVITTIPLDSQPVDVAISKDGSRVYVTGQFPNYDVSVINTATNTVIATIPVGTIDWGIAISPDGSRVYVANGGPGTISVINTATNTVVATIPVGNDPVGLVISPDGSKLYATITGAIAIISTATNTLTGSFSLPYNHTDFGLNISPDGQTLYVPNALGQNITIINTTTGSKTTGISGDKPYTIAVNADGSEVYIVCTGSNTYTVLNTANNIPVSYGTGNRPAGIAASRDGTKVYVLNSGSNDMYVMNTVKNNINQSVIPLGANSNPQALSNFLLDGSGCTGAPITFTITVDPTPPTPTITPAAGSLSAVNTIYGTPSASSNFTVSGSNISADILVTPPSGFEVSTDNINFTPTVTVGGAGTISALPVYIRLAAITAVGGYSGNIQLSNGATTVNLPMPNSVVSPTPLTITANNISKVYGQVLNTDPASTAFGITAGNLKNANTISSVTLTYGNGANATAPVGIYPTAMPSLATGSNGFASSNYGITYNTGNITVTPAQLTITADNKHRVFDKNNPPLTASYSGFVNNETATQLTTQPLLITTAIIASPAGQYDILVSGASAINYDMAYITGVLTIDPAPVTVNIPNIFTPNGDGVNDTWNIPALSTYENSVVDVYSRWGQLVYHSKGYPKPWDGTLNGSAAPVGTYYYIIQTDINSKPLSGQITIIR